MRNAIDISGHQYGKLTVVKHSHTTSQGAHWICLCECGGTKIATAKNLRNSLTRSCGCIRSGPKVRTRPVDTYLTDYNPNTELERVARMAADARMTYGSYVALMGI